jgi:acetylornithine deacetylase/succinyl-diaminopimelate desuccinylase-like protein
MPDGCDDFFDDVRIQRGASYEITTKGKAGHAAYPWNGISANDKLVEILTKLRQKYPTPTKEVWENTLNIGIISGGKQTNQISDEAMCKLDFRLIPGTDFDKVISEVKTISSNAMVEVLVEASPFWVDSKNRYVQEWIKVLESKLGKQVH